jgi:hypothetical protein
MNSFPPSEAVTNSSPVTAPTQIVQPLIDAQHSLWNVSLLYRLRPTEPRHRRFKGQFQVLRHFEVVLVEGQVERAQDAVAQPSLVYTCPGPMRRHPGHGAAQQLDDIDVPALDSGLQ